MRMAKVHTSTATVAIMPEVLRNKTDVRKGSSTRHVQSNPAARQIEETTVDEFGA